MATDREWARAELGALARDTPCVCFDEAACGNGTGGYAVAVAAVAALDETAPRQVRPFISSFKKRLTE